MGHWGPPGEAVWEGVWGSLLSVWSALWPYTRVPLCKSISAVGIY